MPLKFDDSLPTLIRVLRKAKVNMSEGAFVIVRETTGRLVVAYGKGKPPAGLSKAISQALGTYAAPPEVIEGAFAIRLSEDPSARDAGMDVDGEWSSFRFIDRRLVGADWLRAPVLMPEVEPPRLVLGSLKGGVGRSTAIAVLAAEMAACGKKVLVVDLDLEAPGIGSFLLPAAEDHRDDRRPRYGVIDYLVESNLCRIPDEELVDYTGVSPLVKGLVHVLPAVGRVTDKFPSNMMAKLSRSMVERISPGGERTSVAENVKEMIDRFSSREPYDIVLVDARAGLAELSAAALFGIGAHSVLLFGTDQQQTFRGYRYMLAHLADTWGVGNGDEDDWRSRLVFVHAKAPSSRKDRQSFRDRLYELCADELYDREDFIDIRAFNFSLDETGLGIPHDATHVAYSSDYDAFDPVDDRTRLEEDVYRGPFGNFLDRTKEIVAEAHFRADEV